MNRKIVNILHNNISNEEKLRINKLLGFNVERGIEMDASLVNIGLDDRKAQAKKKCAERRKRREERERKNKLELDK